jgi:sulfoxide reductase catalytic subunit YedY
MASPEETVIGSSFQNLIKSPFSTTEKPSSFGDVSHYNNFSELGTDKSDPAKNPTEVQDVAVGGFRRR